MPLEEVKYYLAGLGRALGRQRGLRVVLDSSCLRCGTCLQRCPFHLGTDATP